MQKLFVIWICGCLHTEQIFLLCNESVRRSATTFFRNVALRTKSLPTPGLDNPIHMEHSIKKTTVQLICN